MVKAQYYVIESILVGILLLGVIGSIFYFGTVKSEADDVSILDNYCQDSLQMVIKQELIGNDLVSINELNNLIPSSLRYCLRIDGVEINRNCDKVKGDVVTCRGLYASYSPNYTVKEVVLSLS